MDEDFLKDFVELKGTNIFALGDSSALFLICEEKVLLVQTEANFAENASRVLAGKSYTRPQTYELLAGICKGFEITPKTILISDFRNEIYFARIVYSMKNELGEKLVEIDARTSDAILQSMIFHTKVFVARSVIATAKDASSLLELAKKREKKS